MKKNLFCILLFWIWNFSFSQSSLPKNVSDSLWNQWQNSALPDTIRLIALQEYTTKGYLISKPDSAFCLASIQYAYAEKKDIKKYMAFALQTQGLSKLYLTQYDSSLSYFSQALEIQRATGSSEGVIINYIYLGNSYSQLGNLKLALLNFTNALHEIEKSGLTKHYANVLLNLGITYRVIGDLTNANHYLLLSLPLLQQSGNKSSLANVYRNLGVVCRLKGDFAKAHKYLEEALQLYEGLKNYGKVADCHTSFGNLYSSLNDLENAIYHFTKALTIYLEKNDKEGQADTYNNIGIYYRRIGELDKAEEVYLLSQSLNISMGIESGGGAILLNLGIVKTDQKDFVKAKIYFSEALTLFEKGGDKKGIAATLLELARLSFELSDFQQAFDYYERTEQLALESGLYNDLIHAKIGLYLSYLKLSNPESAMKELASIRTNRQNELATNYFALTEHEKELYFSSMEVDFGRYYDFALFYHSSFPALSDTAYNIALQNKGLTLKSSTAMRFAILNSGDSSLIADYDECVRLRQKISELYSTGGETKEYEIKANELEKKLIAKSSAFSDYDKIKNLDWHQVQASLQPDECAIEFVNFKSDIDSARPTIYAALLIKSDSKHPEIIRLCNESDLVNILGTFQGNNLNFVNTVYGKRGAAQTALYEKIWHPIEPFLKDVKKVYYSPDGLLHKVSFSTICKKQDVFLSDVYNFRQMGSTGNLAFENSARFGEFENFLLMGGVEYSVRPEDGLYNGRGEVWSYLPGSLTETEVINMYLLKKKIGVNYFSGSNASEEIFKEKIVSSSIVHIATHGFFFPDPEQVREEMNAHSESNKELIFRGAANYANWSFVNNKNPLMRSGIVLANANDVWNRDPLDEGEDGILTAQEVSNLDLRNTKLVVLSACETGLGDIKGSEGVFGLQRAFKMAGVKYLIMSLWQVPDKETSEFMILFYKNLIKVKDIPMAFQKTQKVMRQKYDPYYWGAFVLIE